MKKKFLLHVCCGPCVLGILKELKEQFDLTVYFYNPNIHPQEEYEKRKAEVIKICKELNIPFIEAEYNSKDWFAWAEKYKDESEGGERCKKCFAMRLERTARYASGDLPSEALAKEGSFDYFGLTLTSGRNKKADVINPLGVEIGERYGIKFYEEDWKKKGRQECSIELCKERGVYRQSYCGCSFSRNI